MLLIDWVFILKNNLKHLILHLCWPNSSIEGTLLSDARDSGKTSLMCNAQTVTNKHLSK